MKKLIGILFVVIAALFLSNCKRTSKPSGSEQKEIDALVNALMVLEDSVDSAWEVMINDDDEKIQFMKRLLLEVSYTNIYNKDRFEELNQMIEDLQGLRYDRNTMSNSDLIDQYDSATFEVTGHIFEFVTDHPSYDQFPLMEELISDINDKNGMILIYRVHYDGFAIERNKVVQDNNDGLSQRLSESDLQLLPLFQLAS